MTVPREGKSRKQTNTPTRPQVKETNREKQIGGVIKLGPDRRENKLVGWFNIA